MSARLSVSDEGEYDMFAKFMTLFKHNNSNAYHVPSHVGTTETPNTPDCDRQIALMHDKALRPFPG